MADRTKGFYNYITGIADTVVKDTPGILRRIIITEAVASTIIVYDDPAAVSTAIIASFVASAPVGRYEFNCVFRNGLFIVTAGASKLTVIYE